MIKLAVILVHNKTDVENQNQIEFFKPLIQKQTVLNDQFDEAGNVIGQFETYFYTLSAIPFEHELRFYQILPYQPNNPRLLEGKPYEGVWPPNAYGIDSHRVAYGKGDEDKTGDHPRFFNWGLKRGTDYGADIVINVDDYSKINWTKLLPKLQAISDPNDLTEFIDDTAVKVGSLKLLKEVGQLDEAKTKTQAFVDLKSRVTEKGFKSG